LANQILPRTGENQMLVTLHECVLANKDIQ